MNDTQRCLSYFRAVVDLHVSDYSTTAATQILKYTLRDGKMDEALSLLTTITTTHPTSELYILMSRLHFLQHNIVAAFHALESARRIEPDHKQIIPLQDKLTAYVANFRVEVNTQAFINRHQVAISFVDLALQLSPNNPELLFKRAELLAALHRYPEAISQLLTLESDLSLPLQHNERAAGHFAKLMAAVQSNHAVALMRANDLDAALQHIDAALKYDSRPTYRYNRADILRKLGRIDESIEDYEIVRSKSSIESECLHAAERLGRLYSDKAMDAWVAQQSQEALAFYAKSIRCNSDNPDTFFRRAKCYLALQNVDRCVDDLQRTLALTNGQHLDAQFLYAQFAGRAAQDSDRPAKAATSSVTLPVVACSSVTIQRPVDATQTHKARSQSPKARAKNLQLSPAKAAFADQPSRTGKIRSHHPKKVAVRRTTKQPKLPDVLSKPQE
ncbi:hypothetical protein RI367_000393 [Sorochytrium milnesiophthora]